MHSAHAQTHGTHVRTRARTHTTKRQVYYNNFRKNETYMDLALQTFARAREVAPQSSSALYSFVRTSVDLCRWQDWEASFAAVERAIQADVARGNLLSTSISLVYLLIYPVADEVLLSAYAAKAAGVQETARGVRKALAPSFLNFRRHTASHSQAAVEGGAVGARRGCAETEVLVIGYVSADYREHPVSLLFQNVPRFHDRCQFRVVCFSLHSPNETAAGDRMRLLLHQNADQFVDLDGLNLAEAAEAIATEGVHVLVDMNGYTQHARPELFSIFGAQQVLSVSLLGFSSSLMSLPSAALASDRSLLSSSSSAPHPALLLLISPRSALSSLLWVVSSFLWCVCDLTNQCSAQPTCLPASCCLCRSCCAHSTQACPHAHTTHEDAPRVLTNAAHAGNTALILTVSQVPRSYAQATQSGSCFCPTLST